MKWSGWTLVDVESDEPYLRCIRSQENDEIGLGGCECGQDKGQSCKKGNPLIGRGNNLGPELRGASLWGSADDPCSYGQKYLQLSTASICHVNHSRGT